ncbi:hypothetical protein SAMN02787142_7372 [Burkholderia sp. WP9]|jgi:hypothetical protein|uniref:hypothetical protein n=1 Tax=Burkholderia sp. WP9 TaxID=1500263 RepID=UPI000897606B|nr:hypothetical protein [Burkholderia sp. WP9]SEF06928.1 hypothetical protein SAMN02787142_7372 [Burkholderia sp. WP9]
MFNDPNLPHSLAAGLDVGGRMNGLPLSAAPPRFGRFAMCVAVASALAIGVMGTVAYGVWFNHDQKAYTEAMAGARQALGSGASGSAAVVARTNGATSLPSAAAERSPTVTAAPTADDPEAGGQLATFSGEVKRHSPPTVQTNFVTDAAPDAPASSASAARRSASVGTPAVQQAAPSRAGKDSRATPQERRTTLANAKHKDNAFTRIGLFFRRVNYRQHGNANRQDIYSHP